MSIAFYYLLNVLAVLGILGWVEINESGIDFDEKGAIPAIILSILFAPLTMIGFGALMTYLAGSKMLERKAFKILNKWQHLASTSSNLYSNRWKLKRYEDEDGVMQETFDEKVCTALSEVIKLISTKDLKFLVEVPKQAFLIDRTIKKMIMDEIVDRELLGHE